MAQSSCRLNQMTADRRDESDGECKANVREGRIAGVAAKRRRKARPVAERDASRDRARDDRERQCQHGLRCDVPAAADQACDDERRDPDTGGAQQESPHRLEPVRERRQEPNQGFLEDSRRIRRCERDERDERRNEDQHVGRSPYARLPSRRGEQTETECPRAAHAAQRRRGVRLRRGGRIVDQPAESTLRHPDATSSCAGDWRARGDHLAMESPPWGDAVTSPRHDGERAQAGLCGRDSASSLQAAE